MKKKLSIALILVMALTLLFTACQGDRKVESLELIEGLKTEYELNETPDFSGVKVLAKYNDGSTEEVDSSKLTFSQLDTSIVGKKKITITYEGAALDINVEVKGKSIDVPVTPTIVSISYLSGLPTQIYTGESLITVDIKIVAKYSDGSESILGGDSISTNLSQIDTSVAGEKTVTIKYQDFETTAKFNVVEPHIIGIEVDADSVDTVVEAGGTLDLSTIVVYAVYDNNSKIIINNADPLLDLTNIPDLSTEGDKDFVITYGEFSFTLKISTTPPVVESISLNLGSTLTSILIGDTFNTEAISATALLSNNTTRTIANNKLIFDYDVSSVGTSTVKVTYAEDESIFTTFDVTVLDIKSIKINTSSISTKVTTGKELDVSALEIIITCSDDSIVTRNVANGVTVNTDALDTSKVGNESYITASYRGVTSDALTIIVYDEDTDYYVSAVTPPESLTKFDTNKADFINKNYGYVVGDDNNFYINLILSAYTKDGVKVENITEYISVSQVYLGDSTVALAGDELASYVAIDETAHAFDFTELAIGKTFRITTRPRDGVSGAEGKYTVELVVTVVDGYNVYNAYELNVMTNDDDFDFDGEGGRPYYNGQTQTQIVDEFLATHGITRPATLGGIVLHNNLVIEREHIPAKYFLGQDYNSELYDYISIFAHATSDANPSFTIHGNYFAIYSYKLPTVCKPDTGNQTDTVSNGQLFKFAVDATLDKNHDYTKYTTTVSNLFIRDDHPQNDNLATANRDMRGLIGIKSNMQVLNIDNTKIYAYYISHLGEMDYHVININESIYDNAWQNHLYLFSKNGNQNDDDEPLAKELYPVLTVNITKSQVTTCGGPVIISQTSKPEVNCNKYSGPVVNIDADTKIETWVTGQEAWFKAMGVGNVADGIKALDVAPNYFHASFLKQETVTDSTGATTDATFMNIILVNIMAPDFDQYGTNAPLVAIGGNVDIDGKLAIGEQELLGMNDDNGNYADALVSGYKAQNFSHVVMKSSGGGIIAVNEAATDPSQKLIPIAPIDGAGNYIIADGEYLSIYYNAMGIVLGGYHKLNMQ